MDFTNKISISANEDGCGIFQHDINKKIKQSLIAIMLKLYNVNKKLQTNTRNPGKIKLLWLII